MSESRGDPTRTGTRPGRHPPQETLFERLGGRDAIDAAVTSFYGKVLADGRISDFFDGFDINDLRAKQGSFLALVSGGPNEYRGLDLRVAHARLLARGLDDSHFDALVQHLEASFRELGVSEQNVSEIGAIAESVRDDVLGR